VAAPGREVFRIARAGSHLRMASTSPEAPSTGVDLTEKRTLQIDA
jgi:hypothetical protein